jgi:hypothetical protein
MTRFLPSAFPRRVVRPLRYSALLAASALYLAGCGGGGHSPTTASTTTGSTTRTAGLRDAIAAPAATVLKPGQTVNVPRKTLTSSGWQASCVSGGIRVNAEAVRGQRTGSGRIVAYAGGSPSIWVKHNDDGSITLACR